MKPHNLILLADAYKYSHYKLYYPGTSKIYSYLESRGGKFQEVVFFGLQYFLKTYLGGVAITTADIDEAEAVLEGVFGRKDVFDRSKFDYIVEKYGGKLPVRIKAVPEGTVVPYKNVMMTIESTDPQCFWLSNFLETVLMQIWYPCTVATISREVRKLAEERYARTATAGTEGEIDFVLNDFGFRGVSSVESAAIGGAAHLVNFSGSDNIAGSTFIRDYYKGEKIYGLSIPATEHSNMTLLGEEGEKEIFQHVLNTFSTGMVACVSDSYNIFRACEEYWGEAFKDQILNRDGRLVVRPDSGDPLMSLLKIYEILFKQFGFTVNDKGFKVLPPQIRVIQGDGVNYDAIKGIYDGLEKAGISAENLVFGMGGALLQKLDRDTQKFALKCSYAEINGNPIDVKKSPLEMNAEGEMVKSFKTSKAGRLKLVEWEGSFKTVREEEYPELPDQMQTVFENGELLIETDFEAVRERARVRTHSPMADVI